jgi:hypothetical protein
MREGGVVDHEPGRARLLAQQLAVVLLQTAHYARTVKKMQVMGYGRRIAPIVELPEELPV